MAQGSVLSRRGVVVIGITAFAFAVAAWIGARFMQRAYMSTITMLSAVEDNENTLARVTNQLGAVAGLLGVGGGGQRRDINESLATLSSRLLVAAFIEEEQLLDDIAAIIGPEAFEQLSKEDQIHAAVSYFQNNILGVSFDIRTNLFVVSITWIDRHRAAELANRYVAFANEAMRQRGITAARNRMAFLNKAANEAATVELRQAIYRLYETQVNAEMMAATKVDFAFTVVDPAVPSGINQYVRPQKWLMVMIAAMFGAALAAGVLFLRGQFGGTRSRS